MPSNCTVNVKVDNLALLISTLLHLVVTLETKLYVNINMLALHRTVLLFTLSVHLQHKISDNIKKREN